MKRIFAVVAVSGLIAATGPAIALAANMPSNSSQWQDSHSLTCTAFQNMDSAGKAKALDSIHSRMRDRADTLTNDKDGTTSEVALISQATMADAGNACSRYRAYSVVTALRHWFNNG